MNVNLRIGSNPAVFLANKSEKQITEIMERHNKIEQQVLVCMNSNIKPIDEQVLKRFAYKYATDKYTDENFLDSMLKAAGESENLRLIEAVSFAIENYCLCGSFNLGMSFAKRPDAFSINLIEAMINGSKGNLLRHLLNYARS